MSRFFAVLALSLVCRSANAHVVEQMFVELRVEGDTWEAEVLFDAAYALPEKRDDKEAPAPPRSWLVGLPDDEHLRIRNGAEEILRNSLSFSWNGSATDWEITFPDYDTTPYDFPRLRLDLAVIRATISGQFGDKPGALSLSVAEDTDIDYVVSIIGSTETSKFVQVEPGKSGVCWKVEIDGSTRPGGRNATWLGFIHVLPRGWDHILFVLGIFLLSRDWRKLLWQSLTFTVAHSITLALVVYGVFSFEGKIVEILIALSIAAIAFENLRGSSVTKIRYTVIFVFGLIHGLGFGSVLQDFLRGNGMTDLLLANLGIELAQVAILAACWIITLRLCHHRHYDNGRKAVSVAIGIAGILVALNRSGLML